MPRTTRDESAFRQRRMIRSMLYRNVLSGVLFVVALAGIIVQVHAIHEGLVLPQTRLVLTAYILIAIYAAASIAVRLYARRPKR